MANDAQSPPHPPDRGALVLIPPGPVAAVGTEAAATIRIDPARTAALDVIVTTLIRSLTTLDVESEEFQLAVDAVSALGQEEMRESARESRNLLDVPVAAMSTGIFDPGSEVAVALQTLRSTLEEIQPATLPGDARSERKILGIIPPRNALRATLKKYRSRRARISGILQKVDSIRDALREENASVEREKVRQEAVLSRLKELHHLAGMLEVAVLERLGPIRASDPGRVRILGLDVVFYLRRTQGEIVTHLATGVLGCRALEMVQDNNLQLLKGLDRVASTTVAVLGTPIHNAGGRPESTISPESLPVAINEVCAGIEQIHVYQVQALANFRHTVDALATEVARSSTHQVRRQPDPAR